METMKEENADVLSRSPDSVLSGFPQQANFKKEEDTEEGSVDDGTSTTALSSLPLSSQNGDIWSNILLFLTYDEARRTSRVLFSKNKKQGTTRTAAACAATNAWREIFLRRGFSPQTTTTTASDACSSQRQQTPTTTTIDFQFEYARRRHLLQKLCADGPSSCSLVLPPQSSARFVPRSVVCADADVLRRHRRRRSGMNNNNNNRKALFEFQLASTSVGTELVVLDRGNRGAATVSLLPTVARANGETEFRGSTAEPTSILNGEESSNNWRSVLFTSSQDAMDRARLLPTVYCVADRTAIFGVALEQQQGHTEFRFWFRRDGAAPAGNAGLDVCTCRLPFRAVSANVDFSIRYVFVGVSDDKDYGIASSSWRVEAYRMKIHGASYSRDFDVPSFTLDFKEAVFSLRVSPSGDQLVVATAYHLYVYDLSEDVTPQLVESISFHSAVEQAFEGLRDDSFVKALFGDRAEGSGPLPKVSIHAPRHLPLETAGFITLQTQSYQTATRTFGNHTLYFWEHRQGVWSVYAMVNLPLLLQKTPQIHYDGNRLVVFGKDHIGLIVLVYEVHCTLEAIRSAPSSFANSSCREASGGVYNFGSARGTTCSRVKFSNRLRHVGLGGSLEPRQDLQMSCNERFVILRSCGSYLERGSQDDGLLVIDLLDDGQASVLHNH